jgi:hypothetical protein
MHGHHVASFFKGFGDKVLHKVTHNFADSAPGLLTCYGAYLWGNWYHEKQTEAHWN